MEHTSVAFPPDWLEDAKRLQKVGKEFRVRIGNEPESVGERVLVVTNKTKHGGKFFVFS
jgi:hypothetical protein